MLKSTWKENLKWKTEKMKKVLKFEIQNWFKMISHLADCWWSCRSYNRMYLTMYLKMYLNEVHEVNFSLYLTFHILWYIQRFSQNLTTPHFVEFVVFVVLVVHITYHHTLWYFEKIVTNCAQLCALKCAQIGHLGRMFYCAQLFHISEIDSDCACWQSETWWKIYEIRRVLDQNIKKLEWVSFQTGVDAEGRCQWL